VKGLVVGIVVTAIAFAILTLLLPQVQYDGDVVHLLAIAVLFGVANGLIKPVLKLLSFPISVMTLGLFGIVINAVLFLGVAWVSDAYLKFGFTIGGWPATGFTIDTLVTAVIASVVMGILTAIIGRVIHD
jgi:putative membrane protein